MPTLLCDHETSLIARVALGELPDDERAALDARLAACPACRARLDDYRALLGGVARLFAVAHQPTALAPERRRPMTTPTEDDLLQPPTRVHSRSPRSHLPRRPSALASGLVAALLIVALAGVYAFFGSGRGATGFNKPAATTVATPVPLSCANAPVPVQHTTGMNNTIGHYPFEMGGFPGAKATLEAGGTPTSHGYYGKVVAQVDSGFRGTVTLTGESFDTGEALWFSNFFDGDTGTTMETFHAFAPDEYYVGYVLLPKSGCYALTAAWNGGSWTIPFYGVTPH